MTIKYVNSDFVKNKYKISDYQFQELMDYGLLKGFISGRTILFRKDQLPHKLKDCFYVTPIITTSTENIRSNIS